MLMNFEGVLLNPVHVTDLKEFGDRGDRVRVFLVSGRELVVRGSLSDVAGRLNGYLSPGPYRR